MMVVQVVAWCRTADGGVPGPTVILKCAVLATGTPGDIYELFMT